MGLLDIFSRNKSIASSALMAGAQDRHSHILFGVDDGVKTLEEALEILAYYETLGLAELWCTPHVMEDVPNTTAALQERFAELREAYKGSIRLHLAAEYMLDTVFEQRLKDKDLLLMEDDTILVETSTIAEPYDLQGMLRGIMAAGYRPLLAHPERYRFLGEKDFDRMHEMGVRFQLNLGSVTGYYGESALKKAEYILEKGWYTAFGSDCHRLRSIKQQYTRENISPKILKKLKPDL